MTEEIIKPFFSFNISIYDPIYGNWTYNISNINEHDLVSVEIRKNLHANEQLIDSFDELSPIRKALKIMAMPFSFIFSEYFVQIILFLILPLYFFIKCTRVFVCNRFSNIVNNEIKQNN